MGNVVREDHGDAKQGPAELRRVLDRLERENETLRRRDTAVRRPAAAIALVVLVIFSAVTGFEVGKVDWTGEEEANPCARFLR